MNAHAKWFVQWSEYPTEYGLLFSDRMLLAAIAAVGVIGAAWWIQRNVAEPGILHVFDRLVGWGPFFVGTHAGLPLVVAAVTGRLFAPHLFVPPDALGIGLLAFEGIVGLLLLVGFLTRYAAIGLAILGPLASIPFGWEGIVEQVHFLGIAVFLFLIGRGPLSVDRALPGRKPAPPEAVPAWAVTMLRVLAGFAIAFSALTEKILNPALGQALLREHPYLNVGRIVGMSDATFILAAGIAEFVIGAWIMSGQVTRLAILLAWFPFNVTLLVFGWLELLGHLPIFGIMFMLLCASEVDAWRTRQRLRQEAMAA